MASDLLPVMELPIVPLRTLVLFPHAALPMTLGRASASHAVQAAGEDGLLAVVTQARPEAETPGSGDLYAIGTGAVVRQLGPEQGSDQLLVILEGLERIAILEIVQTRPYLRARVRRLASEQPKIDAMYAATRANLLDAFADMVRLSAALPDELGVVARGIADDSALTDMVASALIETAPSVRQDILATLDVRRRMDKLLEIIARELESLHIRERLRAEVQEKIAGTQRELLLREQLRAIRKELGEEHGEEQQISELRDKLDHAGLPPEAREEATRELDRLRDMPLGSPEHSMVRTYLDWLSDLPWQRTTARPIDLRHARAVLDEDHFDLEVVKERILEHLAVQRLRGMQRAPLLCLVGPPGVGKTSVGKSIARATGRAFVRISLGGTNDEAEIRGHRRTYVGALPGQIIRGLKRAGSRDPVFMLDEVDKLGRDFRGDPAAALLEVLDPEQNGAFRDHYLDLPFDLSRVMFVATANVLDPIPEPLRDRMELLELPGYVAEDKLQIARRYLVPKQISENGLIDRVDLEFTEDALLAMICGYTHEAGVRKLEQLIASICRKRAKQLADPDTDRTTPLVVNRGIVAGLLGPPRFRPTSQVAERTARPGVAVGLAWTPAGGEVLFVECSMLPHGKGDVTLTGQMGEVMQESARTAVSWVRAHARRYGIAEDVLRHHDLHVHVPAGAVPKDGPSAGVVMVTALVSLLSGRTVRPYVALTGEITLSGVVLPVGGIKEKVLAARRAGIRELVLPMENEPNLRDEVPEHLRGDISVRLTSTMEEAVDLALDLQGGVAMAQQIREIMTKQLHTCRREATVREVARTMRDQRIGDVLVCDDNGKLLGIVTDRDLVVRAMAESRDPDQMKVGEIATDRPITIEPSSSVDDAVKLMREKAIRRIPVVENDKPVGIVSIGDLAQTKDPSSALGQISRAAPNN